MTARRRHRRRGRRHRRRLPGPSVSSATHASVRFFTVVWLICFSALYRLPV